MNIGFSNNKLEKECNDCRLLNRRHGARRARLIQRRMVQFRAAPNIATFHPPYSGPARCHELKGDRKGVFSVDLDHPYRLLFRPAHNPLPLREEGGIDWTKVTAIEIIGIEDTHE